MQVAGEYGHICMFQGVAVACLETSDVDPDPVGSAFIWVRGSRGIKLREKQSLIKKKLFFL